MIDLHLRRPFLGTLISSSPLRVFEVDGLSDSESGSYVEEESGGGLVKYKTPYAGTWSVKVGEWDWEWPKEGRRRKTDIVYSLKR